MQSQVEVILKRDVDEGDVQGDNDGSDCLWYVRGPPGTTVKLDSVENLSGSPTVLVYNGLGINASDGIKPNVDVHMGFTSRGRAVTCQLSSKSREESSVKLVASFLSE